MPKAHDVPVWIAAEGTLYWRGVVILRLATWAYAERAVLDAFQDAKVKWSPFVVDPFERDNVGNDATKSRRSALHNLNRRLGATSPVAFLSTRDGQIGWRPTEV